MSQTIVEIFGAYAVACWQRVNAVHSRDIEYQRSRDDWRMLIRAINVPMPAAEMLARGVVVKYLTTIPKMIERVYMEIASPEYDTR